MTDKEMVLCLLCYGLIQGNKQILPQQARSKDQIMLKHGIADNNDGTFPLQSERFYSALKGFGANVRLVMLPHESHGYAARETILHKHWEGLNWMNKYVKTINDV